MRNDIVVPVPVHRSRTRVADAAIDLLAIRRAAIRVTVRREKHRPVPSPQPASGGRDFLRTLCSLLTAQREYGSLCAASGHP